MAKKTESYVLLFLLLILINSCTNVKKEEKNVPVASEKDSAIASAEHFETGKIIKQVNIVSDPSQSYALYLPKKYNEKDKFPVILFFDAHARGFRPLELYNDLADQYGYIIAGSNNSKNGLSPEETQNIAGNFINDIKNRFSIDYNRICTGGFSGGARVASMTAINTGGIRGVLACGAGFGGIDPGVIQNKFIFVGIAGSDDFNNTELRKLDESLEDNGFKHQLLLYEGAHDWCPKEIMGEGIIFLLMNGYKEGLVNRNDSVINAYRSEQERKLNQQMNDDKDLISSLYSIKKLINYLTGLQDISKFEKLKTIIEKKPELQKEIGLQKQLESEEIQKQQYYSNAFFSQDLSWWKNELKIIDKSALESRDHEKSLMYKRIKSFLGVAVYSYANRTLQSNDFNNAPKLITIYKMLEPENTEAWYLSAILNTKRGRKNEAFSDLDSAISKGFNDARRLMNDRDLQMLQQEEYFGNLISKIH